VIGLRVDRAGCAVLAAGALAMAILFAASESPERSVPMFVAAGASVGALMVPVSAIPRSLFAAAVAADAVLTVGGVFEDFNRGDHLGHFVLSGLLIALLADAINIGGTRTRRILVLCAVGAGLGVAWELFELGVDYWLGTDMSRGLRDSLLDLLADLGGAALAAVWLTASRDACR
jgi:hypothetical protein